MFCYMERACLIFLILSLFTINIFSQKCIEDTYLKEIGVKELTGNNDGERVQEYLKSTGLQGNYSWCSAFVKWVLNSCGIFTSITAWSPSAHNSKNIVYFKHTLNKQPKPGDVFCLYSLSKKRIAHTGFFHRLNDGVVTTVEGNTNEGGSFNGDGVYMRKRPLKTIYSITRWSE